MTKPASDLRCTRWAMHLRMTVGYLLLVTAIAQAESIEFSYKNSFDGSEQLAFALVPDDMGTEPLPLLVLAHPGGGTRHAQDYYYPAIEQRGWLLVVPDLHGSRTDGRNCFASLEAQHDILDAISYMRSEYPVDSSRIYMAGRSMGATIATVTAAKHPGLFAAVVAGQGVYDFEAWSPKLPVALSGPAQAMASAVDSVSKVEFGGPLSPETAHAYRRHSAVTFARNLQYVPLVLWHGTMDHLVPPEQTELLVSAIRDYDRFFPEPKWLRGAPHMPMNYPPSWILDQLEHHHNIGWKYPGDTPGGTRSYTELDLTTDEPGQFFWLEITPDAGDVFAEVQASLSHGTLAVHTRNVAEVAVHMEDIPDWIRFSTYELQGRDDVILRILREGESLFTQNGSRAGALPNLWPSGM